MSRPVPGVAEQPERNAKAYLIEREEKLNASRASSLIKAMLPRTAACAGTCFSDIAQGGISTQSCQFSRGKLRSSHDRVGKPD